MTTPAPAAEAGPFAAAWKEFRRRWLQFLGWWIGGPITFFATFMGLGLVLPLETLDRAAQTLESPGALTWMVGSAILAFRVGDLDCPRCGEAFYLKGIYGNLLARRCLHCGLRKGARTATPSTR